MHEPEGDGNDKTEDVSKRDQLVTLSEAEQVMREPAPCDGLRVVLLDLRAGPYVGALNRHQYLVLTEENRVHHD